MLTVLPWALMALAPLAEARFGARPGSSSHETATCCPCISTSLSPNDSTVTVTVKIPQETVTVDHTIVQPETTTVFVTQALAPALPATVTHVVTVHPESPAKIESAVDTIPSLEPSAQDEPIKTVTMTVQAESDEPTESPKTVTVTLKPDEPKSVQSTRNSAVTVTITQQKPGSQPSAEPSRSNNGQGTVTAAAAATQVSHSAESKPSIKTITFVQKPSNPSVDTVTVIENPANPSTTTVSSADKPSSSTSEIVPFVENPMSPSTVTVTIANSPSEATAATVTLANSSSDSSSATSSNQSNSTTETVTFVENPAGPTTTTAALSSSSSKPSTSNSTIEIVPFIGNPPKPSFTAPAASPKGSSSTTTQKTTTSAVNVAKPGVETVTFVPNSPNLTTTNSSSAQPTITPPPKAGTISPSMDHFTTVTQTVSSGGDINIEITIINIFTGEVVCKKKGSDEPCDSKPSPCLTTGIFTSTATAFNTVFVTVSPGMWTNGTSATGVAPPLGTGTGGPVLRRGRVPAIRKRL